jgi:hypothetical protein
MDAFRLILIQPAKHPLVTSHSDRQLIGKVYTGMALTYQ